MKHSFKTTLITLLPMLLIFSWMTAHLAYEPLYPGARFSVKASFAEGVSGNAELLVDEKVKLINEAVQEIKGTVTWLLEGKSEGENYLTVKTKNDQQTKKVLVTTESKYLDPVTSFQNSDIKSIQIEYTKLKPLGKDFTVPLFKWQPGWLGLYIIFSIIFSIGLRKMFKVH